MKQMKQKKHKKKIYKCVLCCYQTCRHAEYKRHLKTQKHQWKIKHGHETKKTHECNICNSIFKSRTTLWRHKKTCFDVKKEEEKFPKVSKSFQKVSDAFLCKCGKNINQNRDFINIT